MSVGFAAPRTAAGTHQTSASLEQRLNALHQLEAKALMADAATRGLAHDFGKTYDGLFASLQNRSNLTKLNGADVSLLYLAASMANFYTFDARYLDDMQLDLAELQKRGGATQANYDEMYYSFIATRQFSRARAFARAHPRLALVRIPEFRDVSDAGSSGPTAMIVSPDGRVLSRRSVNLHKPAQIVVITTPFCHFSQRAIPNIESDTTLGQAFRDHATWLVPPVRGGFDDVEQWNREHPHEAMQIAYKFQEWPMFDRWETPTFYFLKRGKVVAQVVGWPRQGRKREVKAALRRVGLL